MDLIRSGSRVEQISKHRAAMVMMLVTEIGLSMAEAGRQLGLTTGGVAQIIRRRKFV
jgi:DNA-directed RNA polymerase specialized sigma24 family protein